MKYTPPEKPEFPDDDFHPDKIPTTETTKFMRWGTEIEESAGNKDILDRHAVRKFQINKFMPLGNYPTRWKHQKQIEHIRSMEIDLFIEADLVIDAEEVAFSTIQDSQFSRGYEGFYTKEQNRIRYDVKNEEIQNKEKNSKLGFFKPKEPKRPTEHEVRW